MDKVIYYKSETCDTIYKVVRKRHSNTNTGFYEYRTYIRIKNTFLRDPVMRPWTDKKRYKRLTEQEVFLELL